MDTARIVYRRAGWLALLAFFAACGCQTVKTPEEKIANSNIPNEFKKVSMPDYVVEPPDMILVEVLEGLPGRPISGERLVRPDGKISLGWYGDVYVAGLTVPEVKEKIILHLRKFLHDDQLGLIKADDETGDLLTDKNGEYIRVEPRDSDRLFVDVTAYNSKKLLYPRRRCCSGQVADYRQRNGARRHQLRERVDADRGAHRTSVWSGRLLRVLAASRFCRSTWPQSRAVATPPPTTSSCPAIESSSIETRSSGSQCSLTD